MPKIVFANPSVEYRGKPFWAWNGKLDEQELRRQVRILRKMGLAGGFMHSRVGLDTEYLSDELFVDSFAKQIGGRASATFQKSVYLLAIGSLRGAIATKQSLRLLHFVRNDTSSILVN